ncbi:repetitive organellar protein-like [Daktulosphaira vitifoliae]|uniref:repetitive organellar protein-like n=1 Tax=Daktulosphaira vitifoliae TaxID=58002 RepID=UPI0021AA2E2D|nr:repetitive organellar protein-like [Daktulosphaira vitifoliae]
MEKDLVNFKKWFNKLGKDIEKEISDDILKKLIPPQRRDMWRNIIERVLPQEEVILIKKSILLHKLQKRQSPLIAKVETVNDLNNALKYEELMNKYLKIQKELSDTKLNNDKVKSELNEIYEYKNSLLKNIKLNQDKMYLVKRRIDFYETSYDELKEMSDICNLFSMNPDDTLTKTDYEDSLIECLTQVDEAKQLGIMNESVGIGKNLCQALYATMRNKSPAIMISTIEDNFVSHINKSNEVILETNKLKIQDKNGNEKQFNEILINLQKEQLYLNSKLSIVMKEKERKVRQLKEAIILAETEIINQYKLKNVTSTDDELLSFKNKLESIIKSLLEYSMNSINSKNECTTFSNNDETFCNLNEIMNYADEKEKEIEQKVELICGMLDELNCEKSNFGSKEAASILENIYENYSNKFNSNHQFNKIVEAIKDTSKHDIDNIINMHTRLLNKPCPLTSKNIEDMKQISKLIKIVVESATKLEKLNNTVSQNEFKEIEKNEKMHRIEFQSLISEVENTISLVHTNVENCKLVSDMIYFKK